MDLDREQTEIEEASDSKADSDEDGGVSYQSMLAEKKQLTQEVRKAGITSKDESFMDDFSEAMVQNKSISNETT